MVRGIVVDLRRRPHLPQPTVVDHRDAVAHAHRLNLVMCDINGGGPNALLELSYLVARRGTQLGVKIGERFVEQKYARITHQGPGKRDALPLAAGQLPRAAIEQVCDAEQLCRPRHFQVDCGFRVRAAGRNGKAILLRTVKCG